MTDRPSEQEIAEASAELAAISAAAIAAQPPDTYVSRERGPVPIAAMDSVWAERAAKAVQRGDRPEDPRSVIPPLKRQSGR